MFSRIQTRYFRSLKAVNQSLGPIQALVGPNASGKTTFLDVIGLLSDLVHRRGDVRETVLSRSANFEKLLWQGPGRTIILPIGHRSAHSEHRAIPYGSREAEILARTLRVGNRA